jgi:hypothetical protein
MDHQAFAQLLGSYGEFIGSVAILVTLIYLAIQTRQTGSSTVFAAVQANRAERMAWFQSTRDSPYMPKIFMKVEAGEQLDAEEAYRLRSHNSALWGSIYSQWLQLELGLMGRFATKDLGMINMALTTPGAIEWWKSSSEAIYPDAFCEYIDRRLTEIEPPMNPAWNTGSSAASTT